MIWFACKQCGKTHSRPESSSGTILFCNYCGHGNMVPWESTASPAAPPSPSQGAPAHGSPSHGPPAEAEKATNVGPTLEPLKFDPVEAPTYSSFDNDPRPRSGRRGAKDPRFCFNHQQHEKAASCASCGEPFCTRCLVEFQGEKVCAPCKNYISRGKQIPPRVSPLATCSLFFSMLSLPIVLCVGRVMHTTFSRTSVGISAGVQLLSLVLGILALWSIARKPGVGGLAWAVSGVVFSSVLLLGIVLVQIYPGVR